MADNNSSGGGAGLMIVVMCMLIAFCFSFGALDQEQAENLIKQTKKSLR